MSLKESLRNLTSINSPYIDSLIEQLENASEEDKIRISERIAWYIPTGGSEDAEDSNIVKKEELLEELKEYINEKTEEPEVPEIPEEKDPEEYAKEVVNVLSAGGTVSLSQDLIISTGKSLTLTKESILDMEGHTVEVEVGGTYGDTVVIGNGARVTLNNGEIKPAGNSSQANQSATILIKTAQASQLELNETKVTGYYPVYLNSANEESSVVINSGEYYAMHVENPAVYVGKGSTGSTIGGNITINGGTFGQPGITYEFLCNVEDVLRKQEGKKPIDFITIKGGKFYNWDPSNNKSEGPGTNFVPEGYKVVKTEDGTDIIYTVEKI